MKIKAGLFALGAASSMVFFSGATANAESNTAPKTSKVQTPKKADKKVYVTVKSGDSLSSIAKAKKTSFVRIFNANAKIANPNVISAGDKIRIPAKGEKLPNRYGNMQKQAAVAAAAPVAVAPVAAQVAPVAYAAQPAQVAAAPVASSHAPRGSSAGNTYAQGYCTWYVKNMRGDLPNQLGNGGSWSANAAAQGFKTGSKARAGAVAETAGHVAYVDSVNSNGTINISEMNYAGGIGQVNNRTVSAKNFHYIY